MFEQELYEKESAELATEPGDLFHNYEIEGWELNPRIYKIVAVSTVLNILAFFTLGQPQLFSRGACESPFVGRVCSVLDTVYVGSILFGTERDYVDKEYEKTELSDADIVWIDQTGVEPQFTYPAGYFYKDPAQMAAGQNQFGSGFLAPGIPSTPNTSSPLINTPQILPKSNPNAVTGKEPDNPFSIEGENPTTAGPLNRKGRGGRPIDPANANANTQVANANTNANTTQPNGAEADEAKPDQFGIFINKRPLRDRAKDTLVKMTNDGLKLDGAFSVSVVGTLGLDKNGKTVVLKDPKPLPTNPATPNDPAMEKLVQDWILAVGDAGWFGYLDKLKAKKVIVTVEQNDTELVATVRADQPTENLAKQAASGLNGWIALGAATAQGDELEFLKKATTTADGKTFVLNVTIPKAQVQEMIMRRLNEAKEKEAKPSSTAVVAPGNNSAAK